MENIPTEPQFLDGTIVDSSTIMLKWQPPLSPNGIIIAYHVLYSQAEPLSELEKWKKIEAKGSQLSAFVYNITTDQQYYFCIRAVTKAGIGPPSSFFTIMITSPSSSSASTSFFPSSPSSSFTSESKLYSLLSLNQLVALALGVSLSLIFVLLCTFFVLCRSRLMRNARERDCYSSVETRNTFYHQTENHFPIILRKKLKNSKFRSRLRKDQKEIHLQSFNTSQIETFLESKNGHLTSDKTNGHCKIEKDYFNKNYKTSNEIDKALTSSMPLINNHQNDKEATESVPLSFNQLNKLDENENSENSAPDRPGGN